ncbi:unnamed protein product [[Actinomadura] parvosata subsp. kistnae]|uniref:Uncharacterized protein n=1 Tax=[Actinomadura] parvosata subsp. kistnae TaxID=1909395 RepID=A0A1V0ALF3_9ACTN|nr:hypothetical protein [Nonomuraea sp. ATCC 55076]AQZ71056.1 hypothetical protein BKM31_41780 [Nonomuraea sp. ATCC 55076]SPL94681.1 unnamed protein product [Actinomadura parvosata subsp. kistnae]
MGTWVYVRGWLEFHGHGQRAEAERVIRERDAEGWAFPAGGWLDAACYARAVRASDVDDLLDQLRRIAALPADADGDRVCGLFLAFHETDGQFEWQVRDGEVVIAPAAPRYDYLWK